MIIKVILLFGILVFIVLVTAKIEQQMIKTSNYIVESKKIPQVFSGTTFVVLSDLHNHSIGNNNKKLRDKINELSPDYILIAGDMITKEQECRKSVAYELLSKLAKEYKIYYAYGNHEQHFEERKHNSTWVEYVMALKEKGIEFLDNDNITLTKPNGKIRIAGVSIGKEYFKRGKIPTMEKSYLDALISRGERQEFQILLAHHPMYFETYAKWGADLTLSGHLHGGIIRLPKLGGIISPQVNLFPKYDGGNYRIKNHDMIVSKGLGSHSLMIRIFNPPELISFKLKTMV